MRRLVLFTALLLVGCGVNPGTTANPVDIEGKVTIAGKEVNGVILNLQATGDGTPATLPVTKGEVKGKVIPGKYTYFLSQASNAAAFKSVPQKYREGAMDRQVVIKNTGGPVEFTFE